MPTYRNDTEVAHQIEDLIGCNSVGNILNDLFAEI